jgi:hypothetical protein
MLEIPPIAIFLGLGLILTGWSIWALVRYALHVRRGQVELHFNDEYYLWFALGLVLLLFVLGVMLRL